MAADSSAKYKFWAGWHSRQFPDYGFLKAPAAGGYNVGSDQPGSSVGLNTHSLKYPPGHWAFFGAACSSLAAVAGERCVQVACVREALDVSWEFRVPVHFVAVRSPFQGLPGAG